MRELILFTLSRRTLNRAPLFNHKLLIFMHLLSAQSASPHEYIQHRTETVNRGRSVLCFEYRQKCTLIFKPPSTVGSSQYTTHPALSTPPWFQWHPVSWMVMTWQSIGQTHEKGYWLPYIMHINPASIIQCFILETECMHCRIYNPHLFWFCCTYHVNLNPITPARDTEIG